MSTTHSTSYIPEVSIAEYAYELPEERIAFHPLARRDRSRLLVADVRTQRIEHRIFSDLVSLVPSDAMLVVNDTRVVRARIVMRKETGGRVELFLLEPIEPSPDPARALTARGEAVWQCMIGGARKLRHDGEIRGTFPGREGRVELTATVEAVGSEGYGVRFKWTPEDLTFADILEEAGRIPLPPYIKRETVESDATTYQTVYAEQEGAVAAPTAGLHFTPETLEALREKGVAVEQVTLHVGAGTFKQVAGERVEEHEMHQERIVVTRETLHALIDHARRRRESSGAPLVLVGTTTLRTMETLYWFGVRLLSSDRGANELEEIAVEQWDPYRLAAELDSLPDLYDALEAVEEWRATMGINPIFGRTRILIVPGYEFRGCDALVTNFHQPGSTLILLVGALLGREFWRRVYNEALAEGYRFLSYGDSSLLIRERFEC